MPFYDYFCRGCKKKVNIFWRSISEAKEGEARCPDCQSRDLQRRVSPFRQIKSSKASADPELPFDESEIEAMEREDPKTMARMFKRMSNEMGEEMDGEMEEVVHRLEKGEDPGKIERDLESKDEG